MNDLSQKYTTFQPRTVRCPDGACDDGKVTLVDDWGFRAMRCDECAGRGIVDASCAECNTVRPLNTDGVCSDCALLDSFTVIDAVLIGDGRWEVRA